MFKIAKCFINNNDKYAVLGNGVITFGWQTECDKNNTYQTAYEIELFNYKNEVIWKTDKIMSNDSNNIQYSGIELTSRKEYFWTVTVWNNYNEKAKSEINKFEMGLNKVSDWSAKWIESDNEVKSIKEEFDMRKVFSYHSNPEEIKNIPLDFPIVFSKEFVRKDKKIKRARIYATARGVYEINLNSQKVGDQYLAPGFSTYNKIQYYQTYDITNQIKAENNIEITVADGWYKGKIGLAGIGNQFGDKVSLLAQIEIEYEDNERQIISTDRSFTVSNSEIEYSDLFIGEKQNHTIKKREFFSVLEKDYGYSNLKADSAEPIRCIEKIKVSKVIVTPNGDTVLDFGRNIAGIVEVKVKGQRGNIIVLQHTEELDKDGNFFFNLFGQNKYQTTTFVLDGGKEEVFLPKFTYQGFRYVKVTGNIEKIDKDNFTAYVLSSDLKRSGRLKTSNDDINKLLENIYNSQESNFISVPTDCPQREKGGWTGDAQIYTPTAIFNMNINNFMKRWLENMRLDQFENGQIPGLIPFIESDKLLSSGLGNVSCAGWADACITIPYNLYVQYEDISYLEDNYCMMKKWISYVEKRCKSNLNSESKEHEKYLWNMEFHYGDWMTPSLVNEDGSIDAIASSKLTGNQVATMYYAYSTNLLSKICRILKKEEECRYYEELSKKIKDAFVLEYVDDDGKIYGDMQGLYALAAYFEIGSSTLNKKFINNLVKKIKDNQDRLDTGFLATPILLDVLTNYGEKDVAYKLLLQDNCPSWLYMVKQNATTIWESWDAIREDGTRNITSYNHYSLGSVQDFIVRKIAGLIKVEGHKGEFILEPDLNGIFKYCSLSYESLYGKIEASWNIENSIRKLEITVPVGVTLIVKLPHKKDVKYGSGKYTINL